VIHCLPVKAAFSFLALSKAAGLQFKSWWNRTGLYPVDEGGFKP
jgi:hypothetical protein